MYAQALHATIKLTPIRRAVIMQRLESIRMKSEKLAYGVWEEMTSLIVEYQTDESGG
jgi:hypothetical protein